MTDRPLTLTPEEVADLVGCCTQHVRRACREGRLDHFKVGARYRILPHAVEAWVGCALAPTPDHRAARGSRYSVPEDHRVAHDSGRIREVAWEPPAPPEWEPPAITPEEWKALEKALAITPEEWKALARLIDAANAPDEEG